MNAFSYIYVLCVLFVYVCAVVGVHSRMILIIVLPFTVIRYWGHEHRCLVYDTPLHSLRKARCVGHAAMPEIDERYICAYECFCMVMLYVCGVLACIRAYSCM